VSDVAEPATESARAREFDRPPPPHDWRWWVGGIGRTLIATGLLMFGFVAYQLWGTGIETARAQNALENEFEELLSTAPPVTTAAPAPVDSVPADPDTPIDSAPPVEPPQAVEPPRVIVPVEEGDPIARIEMPSIGVDNIVVAGVSKSDLKKGPGHYPETPLPGQLGNAAIAGHRTTYGQPFFNVDKLEVGDEITVTTLAGRFVYRVTGQQIVGPEDYQVVATTDPTAATLTLTSCHPKYTARERIIISGELDEAASSAPPAEAVLNYGRPLDGLDDSVPDPADTVVDSSIPSSVPSSAPTSDPDAVVEDDPTIGQAAAVDDAPEVPGDAAANAEAVNAGIADAFSDGWFSDPGANGQVALWGLLLAAVGVLSSLISRKTKRDWVGLTVGIVPFVIVLYFFFQNVNRLLPPNL
jgi:sortase A